MNMWSEEKKNSAFFLRCTEVIVDYKQSQATLQSPVQVDAFLIELLTRFAWDEAGLEPSSRRLPHAMAEFMRPPLQVSARRPFEGFPLVESMAPRPHLGQIFLPENQFKPTATADPVIRRALFDAGDHHGQHPSRRVARSIATLLCWTFHGPKQLKQAIRCGNTPGNIDAVVATLSRRTRPKEIRSLRTLHDATWLLD